MKLNKTTEEYLSSLEYEPYKFSNNIWEINSHPESFFERRVRDADPNALDAEQEAAPFKLAVLIWSRLPEFERRKRTDRFKDVTAKVLKQIPESVNQAVIKMMGGRISLVIPDQPYINDGRLCQAHLGITNGDQEGEWRYTMNMPLPLLFAPKEVIGQLWAHEWAHAWFRAIGRKFDGVSVSKDHPILDEYRAMGLPAAEEEIEVDRLTVEWGFGDRNSFYPMWESSVSLTNSFDCLKVYRSSLKTFKARYCS